MTFSDDDKEALGEDLDNLKELLSLISSDLKSLLTIVRIIGISIGLSMLLASLSFFGLLLG
jgi:hypothetical protein